MLTIDDCHEAEKDFSARASDFTRNLGFAGIALIWIFKTEQGDSVSVPAALFPAAFFIGLGLLLDLTQNVFGATMWGWLHRKKEKEFNHDESAKFLAPEWIPNWIDRLFYAKIVTICVGFVIILVYLGRIAFFK